MREDAIYAWPDYAFKVQNALHTVSAPNVARAIDTLRAAAQVGKWIFVCGNGGSAAISDHLQCDFTHGQRGTALRPRVVSLAAHVPTLTAIANDIGYGNVFVDQLEPLASPGDVLIAVSSSGKSMNIINALGYAHMRGLTTIALTGFDGGNARDLADLSIHVESENYGVIEDVHQSVMHCIAQALKEGK